MTTMKLGFMLVVSLVRWGYKSTIINKHKVWGAHIVEFIGGVEESHPFYSLIWDHHAM